MTTTVKAWGATSATSPLAPTTIERRELGPRDVRIDIAYAGICHSDIHTIRSEWGPAKYPLVVGHEIAGTVSAVGAEVTKHRVGDRVGVGCMVDSCGECDRCERGLEQYCAKGNVGTYNAIDRDGSVTQGGYSEQIVVVEDFVLTIPDALPLDAAAPLLCAGITTYSPLRRFGAGPGKKVAVVGLGGLGHLGVKIGAAMGAEVTVISQSLRKQEDGLAFGAKDYFASSDPATFKELRNRFDMILNTVSAHTDLDAYLRLLAFDGAYVDVGLPPEPLKLSLFSLLANRRTMSGSAIGGIAETQEMLDFCAEHGVLPEIEVISADQVNEAYDRVVASDVRYRFVIDAATL
ncbi:MAG: NAD(P)-dependent alcohol dehydrogenase [Nocardioides sp.]|uniref:NAD(P)-dependent alcohol dehydrogenase n=1 Tax=Nocardioides nematodiphilus TaxID=2849669 RepID=UPI0035567910